MRTLVLSLVLLVTAAPSLPGARSQKACDGAGPYWPTGHARRHGRHCLGRLQGGGPRRSRHALVGLAPLDAGGRLADRRDRRARRRLVARLGRRRLTPRPQERPGHGEDRDGGGGAVQPLDRRRLALVGRRPGGHGPADRSGATEGRRPHPGGRRARGHGLPRQAGVGDQPPRSRPRRDRHGDEPAPEARQRPGGRAGAARLGGGIALGDRPRHRPAPARPGDRRRQGDDRDRRRRHRRRRERQLALGAGARGGGRQGAASRPWRRSGASTPARGR